MVEDTIMDKALLVGINTYALQPLRGCVNDISNMADTLLDRYKFSNASIKLLADGRATTSAILAELEWLIVDVRPGERCVFHFSGHGVQVATRNWQREVDGLDEVICPVDFDWNESNMIRDKQLYQIFKRIPKGVKFGWVNDSCHSGDLTRDMPKNDVKPRTIPLPIDIEWDVRVALSKKIPAVQMSPGNSVIGVNNREIESGELDVGFVSGCKSTQTSADATINGMPCGAMTFFFLKRLKKSGKSTPLSKVVSEAARDMKEQGFTQEPQAEGSRKNLPFLG
jgi:hypothetical protein